MSSATIGLIGAGGISHVHLPGWIALGHPVVVYSLDGNAPLITRRYGGRVVDSLEELLAAADIVDICTPTHTHRELVERAAAAGKHVVCEKPLARTVEDSQAMVDACARAGVRLFPAHVVRYFPSYALARDAVVRGDLGRVAVQRFFRGGSMPTQPWFWSSEHSGGIELDQMIHDFDFARWVAGPVAAVHATRVGGDEPHTPTTVHAILTHESGTLTHVNGLWGAAGLRFRTRYQIAGSGGLLEHDSLEHPVLAVEGAQSEDDGFLPPVNPAASPYTAELRDFAEAILRGGDARVSAADGVEAVRIALDVSRSILENRAITREDPR